MSLQIYFDDFQSLLDQIEGLPESGSSVLSTLSAQGKMTELKVCYRDLVVDCADWLRSESQGDLAVKIESIAGDNQKYSGNQNNTELNSQVRRSIRALRTYRSNVNPYVTALSPSFDQIESPKPQSNEKTAKKVFVVHGHDETMLHQVMRLLSDLGLEGIVLREQASSGRAVIEKLEYYGNVNFAVVLMTADDFGASNQDATQGKHRPRARQNVIMELGYFVGKLTRKNVCVLKENGVEEPSDILGIVYVPIDPAAAWRLTLGKELKAAEFTVDLNKL